MSSIIRIIKEGEIMRTINIGTQQFNKIINENTLYVDKTLFIKEWWENRDDVTLITRPRRFGKTLTMDMMNEFFSIHHKDSQLFNDLNIWKYKEYRELQGTYPVIYLSFAKIKQASYPEVLQKIKSIIINLYRKYHFIIESDVFEDYEKEEYKSY